MREKMKKMLFLMLFLLVLGAANVSAQVRIGGNGQPNPAAVLDLNADNTVTGTKGLALPRVSLTALNTPLTGSPTVNGMLVYNASGSLSIGVYYWDTNKWVKVSDGSFVEGDAIVGNEITDTIANGGLTRTGAGTAESPYKVGIKAGGIKDGMIAVGNINKNKLQTTPSDSGKFLMSDGKNLVFRHQTVSGYLAGSLTSTSASPITWTLILDTILNSVVEPSRPIRYGASWITGKDICYTNRAVLVSTHSYEIILLNPEDHHAGDSVAIRLRCVRPSM
ncbi:hypothetical protein FACS189451_01910 [Bacteroidia bacterium]|nr:hypothetical protein FACS189446_5500 [Bacteroidia bacterium]GHT60921.1 hypothetical protein FACS189451_01910 [Bacteroidia bacterium]